MATDRRSTRPPRPPPGEPAARSRSSRPADSEAPRRSVARRRTLREQQCDDAHARILDAVVATLAGGVTELSMPAVARAAGVSVATVYRHFGDKKKLLDALGEHVAKSARSPELLVPSEPQDLVATVRALFGHLDAIAPSLRALAAAEAGGRVRRSARLPMPMRVIDTALAPLAGHTDPRTWALMRNAVALLWSSVALQGLRDVLRLSVDDAADTVAWAIWTLTRVPGRRRSTFPPPA